MDDNEQQITVHDILREAENYFGVSKQRIDDLNRQVTKAVGNREGQRLQDLMIAITSIDMTEDECVVFTFELGISWITNIMRQNNDSAKKH